MMFLLLIMLMPVKYLCNLILTSNLLQSNCLDFLGLNIHLLYNKLHCDIYYKLTDFKYNVKTFLPLNLAYTSLFTGILF